MRNIRLLSCENPNRPLQARSGQALAPPTPAGSFVPNPEQVVLCTNVKAAPIIAKLTSNG